MDIQAIKVKFDAARAECNFHREAGHAAFNKLLASAVELDKAIAELPPELTVEIRADLAARRRG
jgi:hypothetical protein